MVGAARSATLPSSIDDEPRLTPSRCGAMKASEPTARHARTIDRMVAGGSEVAVGRGPYTHPSGLLVLRCSVLQIENSIENLKVSKRTGGTGAGARGPQ